MDLMREAKRIGRRERIDYRDLAQESVMRQLAGRQSISGPMQDYANRERKHRIPYGFIDNMDSRCDGGCAERALNARIDAKRLLANLSKKQRQAVVLSYLAGMTEVEIAQALRLPVNTARMRVWFGKSTLRKMVKQ